MANGQGLSTLLTSRSQQTYYQYLQSQSPNTLLLCSQEAAIIIAIIITICWELIIKHVHNIYFGTPRQLYLLVIFAIDIKVSSILPS